MTNHSSILAQRTPMDSMKKQTDMTVEGQPPRSEGVQYATGKNGGQLLMAPERMKPLGQSRNNTQLRWVWW